MLLGVKIDPFLPILMGAVALALLWPAPGATGGVLHADVVAQYGILVIFFLYGLSLAPEQLWRSAGKWRVHLLVQVSTFVLFPAVVILAHPLLDQLFSAQVVLGLFFLAALPSTVSSSVAMTSMARGNVPVAIFNASISSLIGVFITPLLLAWYMHATGGALHLEQVILKLVLMVLLPLAVGQVLRPMLRAALERHKAVVKIADRAVIVVIVYNSFCDSMAAGVWARQGALVLLGMAVCVIGLFFIVYAIVGAVCRGLNFSIEDRIATLFCASKKSLATGLPMAGVIFGTGGDAGILIAPLMMFHFFQLVIVSVLASRYARRPEGPNPSV